MSLNQEVREFFQTHPGRKVDNAGLRELLGTDDAQGISVALNVMHNNREIQREKRPSGTGWQYWTGKASAQDIDAAVDAIAAAAMPKRAYIKRKASGDGPKQSRVPREAKKQKQKRKYTKRTPPQAPSKPTATMPAEGSALFVIRNDGLLGIDNDGNAVTLCRQEVQRLQDFLKTVSPLWS